MKIINIFFKNKIKDLEINNEWVKGLIIEDEDANFYQLEFITIDCVRKIVKQDSYMLTIPYRLIVNKINLESILKSIQKLEEKDFFKYQKKIPKPNNEENEKWIILEQNNL